LKKINMKKPALFIGILILLVVILSVVKIFVSNKIATSGEILGEYQQEIDSYKTENAILAERVYSISSLTNIASEASRLGFIEQGSDFVLNGQLPIAAKQ